jgi:hypothetical protein
MAGLLTVVLRAARAMSRQRGLSPAPPFMGAGGSSVGNSAAWLVSSLLCYSLLALCHGSVVGPSTLFLGAGGSSVGNSAAWLVSSLLCYSLLALCHGSVLGPSTPFHGCWWF